MVMVSISKDLPSYTPRAPARTQLSMALVDKPRFGHPRGAVFEQRVHKRNPPPHNFQLPITDATTGKPMTPSTLLACKEHVPMQSIRNSSGVKLQPDTLPISPDQLAAEVKGIYSGLAMVETKCINANTALSTEQGYKLDSEQWQALIALHRTLLYKHHDFLMAMQHPTADGSLKCLATKYDMPARMWKHGIHAFLEVLRHCIPESRDHMLAFIYLAYQMMALLYETVEEFKDTWIECLGDLVRYRMAIEHNREVPLIWGDVAAQRYNEAKRMSPAIGSLDHHLAILGRPKYFDMREVDNSSSGSLIGIVTCPLVSHNFADPLRRESSGTGKARTTILAQRGVKQFLIISRAIKASTGPILLKFLASFTRCVEAATIEHRTTNAANTTRIPTDERVKHGFDEFFRVLLVFVPTLSLLAGITCLVWRGSAWKRRAYLPHKPLWLGVSAAASAVAFSALRVVEEEAESRLWVSTFGTVWLSCWVNYVDANRYNLKHLRQYIVLCVLNGFLITLVFAALFAGNESEHRRESALVEQSLTNAPWVFTANSVILFFLHKPSTYGTTRDIETGMDFQDWRGRNEQANTSAREREVLLTNYAGESRSSSSSETLDEPLERSACDAYERVDDSVHQKSFRPALGNTANNSQGVADDQCDLTSIANHALMDTTIQNPSVFTLTSSSSSSIEHAHNQPHGK